MNVVKQWRCKKEHVLGLVVQNGADVPQLLLYRHAVDEAADVPAEVDVMLGPVTGSMLVRCDICGDAKPWVISVASLIYLVEALPTELLFRFWHKMLERAKVGKDGG